MASADSQRQRVAPEISATILRERTSAAMSGTCRRACGIPRRDGSSQARALTAATTSGERVGLRDRSYVLIVMGGVPTPGGPNTFGSGPDPVAPRVSSSNVPSSTNAGNS